jgi:hypothetical protein
MPYVSADHGWWNVEWTCAPSSTCCASPPPDSKVAARCRVVAAGACHRIGVSFHGCVALLAPCAILRCPRPLHAPSFPALLLMHSPAVAPLRLHYHLCSLHLATRTCSGVCMGNAGHPARLPSSLHVYRCHVPVVRPGTRWGQHATASSAACAAHVRELVDTMHA